MLPDSIAYIQCAGSRDQSMGVSYCSRVCCMYAIKQAMLINGALPLADFQRAAREGLAAQQSG
jgi:heterodisulfide reductase subunit A